MEAILEYRWRQVWTELRSAGFTEKGLDCRMNHLGSERYVVEPIFSLPHEGPAVRAMEIKNCGIFNIFPVDGRIFF